MNAALGYRFFKYIPRGISFRKGSVSWCVSWMSAPMPSLYCSRRTVCETFFELCLQLVMVSRIRPVICWDSRPLQMDTMAAPSTSFLINCVVIIIRNLETEHSKGTFKKPSTLMTQRGLTKPCWQPLERNALFGSMLKIERALLAERRRVWMVGDCVENGARVLPPC